MIEVDILSALQTAAIDACNAVPISVKTIAVAFVVPDNQKYIELVHIENNINGEFWAAGKTYRGIFRLLLHWPNDGSGAYPPMRILENIVASAFVKGTKLRKGLATVQIMEKPTISEPIEAGKETIYSVSVWYQCFDAAA